jgi:hypothetical protein
VRKSRKVQKGEGRVTTREGVIRGDRRKEQPAIVGRKMLETPEFPKDVFLLLNSEMLPTNTDPHVDSKASTHFGAFETPQLLIKQGWVRKAQRFRAARVRSADGRGAVCSQAYVTVHARADGGHVLDSACLAYNSSFALYWLYLSNHRLASFIAEATVTDLLQLPLPDLRAPALEGIATFDFQAVDDCVRRSLALDDTEWALIHDFHRYTLPDFKQLPGAPGPLPTSRAEGDDAELRRYCEYFLRVLAAAFGEGERFSATIFREAPDERLAVRMAAVRPGSLDGLPVRLEPITSQNLAEELRRLERVLLTSPPGGGGITFQRIGRVYDHYEDKGRRVPTLFIIKPDQARYWTASAAMRDADAAFGEIMLWARRTGTEG